MAFVVFVRPMGTDTGVGEADEFFPQKNSTRTLFEYVPRISGGQKPVIEEKDEFKLTIPYLMDSPVSETTEKTRN